MAVRKAKAVHRRLRVNDAYDAVLSLTVPIQDGSQRVEMTAERAFLKYLQNRSRRGSVSASELMGTVHEIMDGNSADYQRPTVINIVSADLSAVARSLKMVTMQDRLTAKAHEKIEPWLVQMALTRLGDRQLTLREQQTVFARDAHTS